MAFDVIVSGLNVVDLLVTLPTQYEAGKKHQVDNILIQGGAPAGNAACGLASLGMSTAFLGFNGDNTQSQIAQAELARCGVDTSLMLHESGAQPAIALVEVDPDNGDRTVFYSLQGYRALTPAEVNPAWVANTRLVFVDGYDVDGNLELLRQAKAANVPSVIDIEAGDKATLMEMLALACHAILPLEAAQELAAEQNPEICLRRLAEHSDGQLVITDGANGSWALDGDSVIHQGIFRVEVVDTTGCGDAYHAAYAFALLRGDSLAERMQFAAAFAALVARHLGGRTAFPSAQQVHSFIESSSKA
ncbi:ribokinase [Neiella marina]|uniref:Ribokinase n=1 Tax=Neiella marina TaxID=508461 RepID=A0A8J2XNV3_9GAMM|nr:PfkB family carbohydrate kinase [Neiella marina]GGA85368.1 ribokinase [Neiella marina]